jgi:hypothetical protein
VRFSVALGLVLSGRDALAQEIRVQESAGIKEGSGQATVRFHTEDGEQVPVRRVLTETRLHLTGYSVGGSFGGTGYGETSTTLCETPCKLSLPPGYYSFRFGWGHRLNHAIDFNIAPGDQSYRVKPYGTGRFVGGWVLTSLGSAAILFGGGLAAASMATGKSATPYWIVAGAGVVMTTGGIVLWSTASASAERE